ncbi:RNA polymerase sigma-70 factor [Fulvivirga ligni]|uniref:RNA polymerase sigma-70 factor n=1 Tax=Fulvivirga ligni TaxID=2904246 RepID=UPI001F355371|nr:RNA polymerase sigma-70 factor [Fulvivirga ligni]UII24265.1 RNA polymerase sigma-70 factor [Fulvivirga ligni]
MLHAPEHIGRLIKAGDEKAFEHLFRANYAGMCGYAMKYLEEKEQAEEVVQDVFMHFWDKRTALEVSGSLEAYLFRSVRNACLNKLKHARVRLQYAAAQEHEEKYKEGQMVDGVVELELQEKIEECIGQLPPERQKIFLLSREEGLKYREIADQLKISVKTVEAQMGKALKFLKENLQEYLPVILSLAYFKVIGWLVFLKDLFNE